jgi:hypothetical protein
MSSSFSSAPRFSELKRDSSDRALLDLLPPEAVED